MGAAGVLWTAWRWRFSLLLLAAIGAGGWALWRMEDLKNDVAEERRAVEEAERINGQMADAFDALERASDLAERALAGWLQRKSSEARRLNDLVQTVTAQEKSNVCAASPAIRSVLDGLRDTAAGGVR